jgi:hydrogenase maturation protein HypF
MPFGNAATCLRELPLAGNAPVRQPERMTGTITVERVCLRVRGVVQGVGFRPFVHRLALRHGLSGFVLNDGEGVVVEAEGSTADIAAFVAALECSAPPLARVDAVETTPCAPRHKTGFSIVASAYAAAAAPTLIPPDAATCNDCLRELFDPADRRYRYPFLNCTNCGPRFTIVTGVPYDRPLTTMAGFPLCPDCRREYEDPADRRFHAEPIACPACGPRLAPPLEDAVTVLVDGGILAVKGLGGYHLACDGTNEAAVARLRARKLREEKPLAVMTPDPGLLAELTADEDALLRTPARPIVLARMRHHAPTAPSVTTGSPWIGLMLPYTPLHHLLCYDAGRPLVMTSGNRSDEPIVTDDEEARLQLGDIADAFLTHDRPIHRRCEDSVVRAGFPVRRSRGHAPGPLPLPTAASAPLVAAGAELKSTFCVVRGREAFLSPHLGDLDSEAAYKAFRTDLALYLEMLVVEPASVACDLHPDYLATRWAHDQELPLVEVQHHHAHAAACLAEHGETEAAFAVVLDGTGMGTDATLWGGELLRCDLTKFERVAHLEPVPLPGGEAAIKEPWRMAAAYLELAERPVPFERWPLVRESLKVNAPLSSGAGRLFDAVAALLGVRERVSYEGQAAMELEHLAGDVAAGPYSCRSEGSVVHGSDLVAAAYDDLEAGRPREEIAAAFHEGVAAAFAAACARAADAPDTVVLSGGSFQNLRLLASLRGRLEAEGFRVLTHRLVPPNDGGVSYGQAAVAAATTGAA